MAARFTITAGMTYEKAADSTYLGRLMGDM
jgi:hypothetical protein